jgi:hypothetical protein
MRSTGAIDRLLNVLPEIDNRPDDRTTGRIAVSLPRERPTSAALRPLLSESPVTQR